ncbi:MAG TPA: hypoxanthine-guanine phosphoribosyltransferase [Gammaproteobacteria bacterium]|nr:hypoxanthine-guanine phosphoribosyltransferase [Gammaproteobacteria bacterium]
MTELARHVNEVYAHAERLYGEPEVSEALARMGEAVSAALAERNPVVLCVMLGGLIPTAGLVRHLHFPFELDYLHATRYRRGTSGGSLQWRARPETPLAGRQVLIVDDILDEGLTLRALRDWCQGEGAVAVETAVLTRKRHGRNGAGVRADYVGLEVPDRYVFGSGMDYRGYLRNAPGIFAVVDGADRDAHGR